MSGEGVIPGSPAAAPLAAIAALKEALGHLRSARPKRPDPLQFDRRPGDLEATRGLASVAALIGAHSVASRAWRVAMLLRLHEGGCAEVSMSADEAERLGVDLLRYAELVRCPGGAPGERK